MNPLKRIIKPAVLFGIGGVLYILIELVARGRSHWSMALLGGACFLMIGAINEYIPWGMGLIWQMFLGGGIITVLELFVGLMVNVQLRWNVWDYSNMPLNLWGQICLPYSLLWCLIALPAILLDDWLRWKLFGEEKPHYQLI